MFDGKLRLGKERSTGRRHGFAYWVAWGFAFAIEVMLGINVSFLVHASVAVVFASLFADTGFFVLTGLIALVVSLGVGVLFVAGGMWTFAHFMTTYEDCKAYSVYYGLSFRWPEMMVLALEIAILLLDFLTLLYRREFFAAKGAEPLFWFFAVLVFMPPILGLLIHVLENTPLDRRLAKARGYAEQLTGDDITGLVPQLDTDERLDLLVNPQSNVIQEHIAGYRDQLREENERREQDAMARRNKRDEAHRPLPFASLNAAREAKNNSQNGHVS